MEYENAALLLASLDAYEESGKSWISAAECFYEDDTSSPDACHAYAEAARMYEAAGSYDSKTKAIMCWYRAYMYGLCASLKPRKLGEYIINQIRLVDEDQHKLRLYESIQQLFDKNKVKTITELEMYYAVIVFYARYYRDSDHTRTYQCLEALKVMVAEYRSQEDVAKHYLYYVLIALYQNDVLTAERILDEYSQAHNERGLAEALGKNIDAFGIDKVQELARDMVAERSRFMRDDSNTGGEREYAELGSECEGREDNDDAIL
ncbi:hypothetical protein EV182_000763 [Spiromyces aspiralis]|uniref:Uncharacterized protein n=1 Tax=Spiromyces aspiralis TaxID=68401 RepID=A0ACC1HUG5_9FUNG|nr:hypothetical protein EV182_000763 [Spiromyces aspiralis]